MHPAIFVFGAPRSGTTIISRHLRVTRGTFGFTQPIKKEKKFGSKSSKIITDMSRRIFSSRRDLSIHDRVDIGDLHYISRKFSNGDRLWDEMLDRKDYAGIARIISSAANESPDAKVFVNKKISNALRMEEISQLFDRSVALCIIRDPYDVVMSIVEQRIKKLGDPSERWGVFVKDAPEKSSDPYADASIQCKGIIQVLQRNLIYFSSSFILGYKSYCCDPIGSLDPVVTPFGLKLANAPEEIYFKSYSIDPNIEWRIKHVMGGTLYENLKNLAHQEKITVSDFIALR